MVCVIIIANAINVVGITDRFVPHFYRERTRKDEAAKVTLKHHVQPYAIN